MRPHQPELLAGGRQACSWQISAAVLRQGESPICGAMFGHCTDACSGDDLAHAPICCLQCHGVPWCASRHRLWQHQLQMQTWPCLPVQALERHPTPKASKRSAKQLAAPAAVPLPKGRKGVQQRLPGVQCCTLTSNIPNGRSPRAGCCQLGCRADGCKLCRWHAADRILCSYSSR